MRKSKSILLVRAAVLAEFQVLAGQSAGAPVFGLSLRESGIG